MTRTSLAASLAALLATPLLAGAAHAQTLTVTDFIGSIETVEGSALRVEGVGEGMRERGGDVVIDGGESLRRVRCNSRDGRAVRVNGRALGDYPTLRVTLPRGAALVVENSILFGQVGDLSDATLALPSCGRLELGDVSGVLDVGLSGSADVVAGDVGEARLATSGAGDIEIGTSETLAFRSSGAGDLAARAVSGPASVFTSGSGDAVVASVGAGLEFDSTGSGDLLLGTLQGPADIVLTGSGDAEVEDGTIPVLSLRSTGSGDFTTRASLGEVDVVLTGSGGVVGPEPSGRTTVRSTGSGTARLGDNSYR